MIVDFNYLYFKNDGTKRLNMRSCGKKSFTIIELSVVLVVASFLIAGAMSVFQVWTKIQREKTNIRKINTVQMSLRAFFARNGRLPYPANPTLAVTNENFGQEDFTLATNYGFINQGDGTTTVPSAHIIFGMIPVSALGLQPEDAFDAYGNRLTYVTHSSLAYVNGDSTPAELNGFAKNMYEKATQSMCPSSRSGVSGCNSNAAYGALMKQNGVDNQHLFSYNIAIKDNMASSNTVSGSVNNVAYAVISHGVNGLCAWNRSGSVNSLPATTTGELKNCFSYWSQGTSGSGPWFTTTNYAYYTSGTTTDKPITLYTGIKTTDFDDLLRWDSLETLFLTGVDVDLYAKLGSTNLQYWTATSSSATPGGIYYIDGATKNVGIGVQDPQENLDVLGNIKTNNSLLLQNSSGTTAQIATGNNILDIYANNKIGVPAMRIFNNGTSNYIGFGTPNPLYPLHITGGSATNLYNAAWVGTSVGTSDLPGALTTQVLYGKPSFYIPGNTTGTGLLNAVCSSATTSYQNTSSITSPTCGETISIYADHGIVGSFIGIISDKRVKKNFTPSNSSQDLAMLMKLHVTDYDKIDNGTHEKKLIAQEVEQVYPIAVLKTTNFIPNINQLGKIAKLNSKNKTFNILCKQELSNELKPGDVIKIITARQQYEVLIKEYKNNTISVLYQDNILPKEFQDNLDIFVYGVKVNDFRTIDYTAISMLNVSATQDLATRLLYAEQEIETLKANIKIQTERSLQNYSAQSKGILHKSIIISTLLSILISSIFSIIMINRRINKLK